MYISISFIFIILFVYIYMYCIYVLYYLCIYTIHIYYISSRIFLVLREREACIQKKGVWDGGY